MLHPAELVIMQELNTLYEKALNRVFEKAKAKFAERGKQYDHDRPYRHRFANLESYATILDIKADRACSELRIAQENGTEFDPDNAIDLITYTAMMLAELDVLDDADNVVLTVTRSGKVIEAIEKEDPYQIPPPPPEEYARVIDDGGSPNFSISRGHKRSAAEIEQDLRTYTDRVKDPNKGEVGDVG